MIAGIGFAVSGEGSKTWSLSSLSPIVLYVISRVGCGDVFGLPDTLLDSRRQAARMIDGVLVCKRWMGMEVQGAFHAPP